MTNPAPVTSPHPETVCRRCGGPNVSWFAPSPLWNAVMRGGSIDGPQEFGELICPTCFAVLAQERGVADGWRLTATHVHVELETVTPSGRVWDAQTDMWIDVADEQVCVDDYPEHDYHVLDEGDGIRTLECRRCGAESFEEADDDL